MVAGHDIWKIFVSLGVPGLALGVFYMLFRSFKWRISAIRKSWAGPIVILFMLIVTAVVFYTLTLWSPSLSSNISNESLNANGSLKELIAILEYRATETIDWMVKQKRLYIKGDHSNKTIENVEEIDAAMEEFTSLHNNHIRALKDGEYILAHNILGKIHELLDFYDGTHYFDQPQFGWLYPGSFAREDIYQYFGQFL